MDTHPIPPSPRIYVSATLSAGSPNVQGVAIPMASRGLRCLSFTLTANDDNATSKNLAATATYEVSNDPRANPAHPDTANAKWTPVTADLTNPTALNPAAAANTRTSIAVDNLRFAWARASLARTAGDGDVVMYVQES